MNVNTILHAHHGSTPHSACVRAVLVYSDAYHEREGKNCREQLREQIGLANYTIFSTWKFEMLACAGLRQIAVQDLQAAPVVLIAASSAGGLPEGVKEWLEGAQGCWDKSEAGWLILLLSENPGYPSTDWPDFAYLKTRARACGRRLRIIYAAPPAESDRFAFLLEPARPAPGRVRTRSRSTAHAA